MKVALKGNRLVITKEKGDPKYRDGEWGSAESRLLYHVKKKIQAGDVENWGDRPTDFVKKRMWKDGHMVDDDQLYLRSRKTYRTDSDGDKVYLAISNSHWCIRGIDTDFNEDGECSLQVEDCMICKPQIGTVSRR